MICRWYALSLGSPPLKREIHWMMSSRLYWGRSSSACRMLDFSSARRFSSSSSRCRKSSRKAAKRLFDSRAKGKDYERAYDREYMFWYSRITKLKKAGAPPEQIGQAR